MSAEPPEQSTGAEPGEPRDVADERALLLDYLDYYRDVIASRAKSLSSTAFRCTVLPSGWTPAGMIVHLTYMERRWFRWGLLAEQVDRPFGDRVDEDPRGPWVRPNEQADSLLPALAEAGRTTRSIVEAHSLQERAVVGGRFTDAASAPRLRWILLHVLQEYARHAGHLDIVCELHAAQPRRDSGKGRFRSLS